MSIYVKRNNEIKQIANQIVQRWDKLIYRTAHEVIDDEDVYTIIDDNGYLNGLTDYTEFYLYIDESNVTQNVYIKYGDERKKLIKTDGSALTLSGKINVYTLEDINIYIDAKIEPFTLNYKGSVSGVFKNFQGVIRSVYFSNLVGGYSASFILDHHGTFIILELDEVQSTHDLSNGEDVYNLCSVYDDTLTKDGVQLSSDDIQFIGREHVRKLALDNVPFYMYVEKPNSTSNVYIYAGDYDGYLKYRLVKEDGSSPDIGELSGRITIIDIDSNNMTATYSNNDITTGLILVRGYDSSGHNSKGVCNIIEGSTIGDFYITNSVATSERTYLFNGRIIWNGRQWLIYPKDRPFGFNINLGLRAIGGILQVDKLYGGSTIYMMSGIGYYYKKYLFYIGDQMIWPDSDGVWRWTTIGRNYNPLSVIVAGRGDIPARGNVKLDFIDGETYTYRRYAYGTLGNYYYSSSEATHTDTSLYGNISLNDLVLENNVLGQNAEDAFDALTDIVKVLKGHLHMSLVPEQEEHVADNHFIVSNEFLANEQLLLVFVNGIQMPFTTDENIIMLNQSIRGQHVMMLHKRR